jgi:hypothetical protein
MQPVTLAHMQPVTLAHIVILQAALACGILADEVRAFVDEAELARVENRGGWHPKVMDTVEQK